MNIGDKLPEILGLDQNGQEITLASLAGRKFVLYAYPKDNTSGCTAEACSLRDHYGELQEMGYEVIGIVRTRLRAIRNSSGNTSCHSRS